MKSLTLLQKIIDLGGRPSNLKSTTRKLPKPDRERVDKSFDWYLSKLARIEDDKMRRATQEIERENAKKFNISVVEYNRLQKKAQLILGQFSTGYSMGETKNLYINGKLFATQDRTKEYSNSCKWSPTHGHINVRLNKTELRKMLTIGGVPTIIGKKAAQRVHECTYLTETGSKGNHKVIKGKCYITNGYHSDTIAGCQRWREDMATILRERRVSKEKKQEALKRFIGFQDSLKAGNCKAGTEAFAKRHKLNIEFGYQLGYLKSLNDNGRYVDNIINYIAATI